MARQPQPEQPAVICSADNQTIKLVRSLRQRKTREAERLFVVEGVRLVDEVLARGLRPKALLIREDRVDLVDQLSGRRSTPLEYRVVEPKLFDSVAETVTPQGVLAVLAIPDQSIPKTDVPLIVVADQIRDPGNLGTLIRVSAGAGATALVITEGSVDPYNSKVVRSAMGAHFQIPLLWLDDETSDWIRDACPNRVLADAGGERDYDHIDWTVSSTLIVGPETGEFSEQARNLANVIARIPLTGEIESLNAAIAGAVMLFEANRQRRAVPPALGRDKGKD
jgi:TrmH family RNA methyltransferase